LPVSDRGAAFLVARRSAQKRQVKFVDQFAIVRLSAYELRDSAGVVRELHVDAVRVEQVENLRDAGRRVSFAFARRLASGAAEQR